ncbi:MAG: ABC transporter substrate-binding protein [Candidatus Competibacteraceae bacterium]|nr:ABC transporter substrate-binding protein [Candidatus Competibacteraceae bacterium]MBK8896010.1 ABC transporter substrate-binding protein [Candidatus Competibacteraceae bacterium]MBK9953387.1 ABC transporter substrate-binding protein [Candidatus Competibacteraceae bacterium]
MKKSLVSAAVLALLGSTAALAAEPALKGVGVTLGSMGNPFFATLAKGAEDKAKELGGGGVKVTVDSADYDLGKQTNQIDNFIAAKVDVIVINPVHPEGIMPAVMRAKEANIPVIAVDAGAEGVDAMITSNNVQAGEKACQYIVDRLKGKGDVVIINGPPVTAVTDRVKGCKDVFAKNPGIKILSDNQNGQGSREGGLDAMSNLLTANPKIDAVFAINDPTGTGADLAARQAKRTEFFIVGVDGAPVAVEALNDKDSLFAATAAQDPLRMAKEGVETGYQIKQGKAPKDKTILIPVDLITRDNVKSYKGWVTK